MALQSPGVQVTVIDESQYTPAEPGTTPLIVVATGQDKTNAAGTGTATATTKANAGKAFKMTSQKDLVDFYGVPFFEKTASSNPVHGGERNEYGLLAAYSLLGVSNAAFIVRADVDLTELEASASAPGALPDDGQWWLDTRSTAWGIQEWNGSAATVVGGQKFTTKIPAVLTDDDVDNITSNAPKTSFGATGDYAVVVETVDGSGTFTASKEYARIYYKSPGNGNVAGGGTAVAAGTWVKLGSQEWAASWPTVKGTVAITGNVADGNFVINGTTVNVSGTPTLTTLASTINGLTLTGVTANVVNNRLYLYSNGATDTDGDSSNANSITVTSGTINVTTIFGITSGSTYHGPRLAQAPHTSVPAFKIGDDDDDGTGTLANGRPTGSIWIKTTEPNSGARWIVKKWNSATETWVTVNAPIYATGHSALYYLDRSGGGANIGQGELFVQSNAEEDSLYDASPETATFRIWSRAVAINATTKITSQAITTTEVANGSLIWTLKQSIPGSATLVSKTISFTTTSSGSPAVSNAPREIADAINAIANFGFDNSDPANPVEIPSYIEASVTEDNELVIEHSQGGEIRFSAAGASLTALTTLFAPFNIDALTGTANFYTLPANSSENYVASGWRPLAATDFLASASAPSNDPSDGQLWYNSAVNEIDIMVHNGNTWVGYLDEFASTKATGPTVSASNPYTGGVTFVNNDLWISTADLENFPTIYRYNSNIQGVPASEKWELVDKTDQTTESGILFADARWGKTGATGNTAATIQALLSSNYLDPDAPDPALYPKGMLLWNTRRSDGNVKRYEVNYIDQTKDNERYDSTNSPLGNAVVTAESMSGYTEKNRWVTASPNNEDGSGTFLRKAQRAVIVAALKSAVDTSQEIRDEERRNFNLIACPGYPELMSNLVNLNIDRGVTAFVIGDTPLRLPSDATSLTNYGSNAELVTDNNDEGIVTYDEYLAVFYPSGFTTDLGGSNAVVPATHMMMKTIALSDNASYPWFAPAGTRRGGITNATSVGYIDSATGEFQTVALNEGQRDTLYDQKINPITFFNGVGLINFGQKTRARNASALDRINVARLTVYLRSQLNKLARPYIFEPNDKITRDEIKQACESLLLELVGLRALYDFAVVCDETNNTPARVDRNELWVDIAIEPVKAVEFIYIPLRVKNTGEI
jgi:phage tail sheath protein FI